MACACTCGISYWPRWVPGSGQINPRSLAFSTLFALTPIHPPLSLTLVWASSISNLLVPSAEVTGAFGADADNQARVSERLVLAFVLVAFPFGVSCLRFSYHVA